MKKRVFVILLGLIFIFGLASCDLLESSTNSDDKTTKVVNTDYGELITVPNKSSYYSGKDCDVVVQELLDAGFTNVKKERVDDLVTGFLTKEKSVDKVSIGGKEKFGKDQFGKDTPIIVYFHAFETKCYDDHNVTKIEAVDSTCAKTGNIEYYKCSRCNKYFSDENCLTEISLSSVTVAKKEHTVVVDAAVAPTPTSDGLTEGSHCSECGTVIVKQKTVKYEDTLPTEYKNALKSAKTYSDYMHMSKQGIYDQLISEYGDNFSVDATQYAVDNLQADYNYNALKSAESYSKTMHMSKQKIYEQLISEYGDKFTSSEAQYAVDNLVADYNANALYTAKIYYTQMSMSKTAIYNQLISPYGEAFTASEAQYAIDHLDD